MEHLTFGDWFARYYEHEGEVRSVAISRFAAEHRINPATLFYALHGARVSEPVAKIIETASSGRVSAAALLECPPRTEVRVRTRRADEVDVPACESLAEKGAGADG